MKSCAQVCDNTIAPPDDVLTMNNGEGPATQQELNNYKHPDWHGNDYEPGRHLMGVIMKVDRGRNEATVRLKLHRDVDGGEHGLESPATERRVQKRASRRV